MPDPVSAPEIVQSLASLSTATLGEVQGGIVDAPLRSLTIPCRLCGPALPVSIPSDDNLSVHHAIAKALPGSVLVVHCENGPTHGFWGEIAAIAAMERLLIRAGISFPAGGSLLAVARRAT